MKNQEEKNPFLEDNSIQVLKIMTNGKMTVQLPTDEASDLVTLNVPHSYFVEKHSKTSVYNIPGMLEKLISLSNSAKNVYFYILLHLKRDCDTINIQTSLCTTLDITEKTLYTAIADLTAQSFILKKKSREYWINPVYFFNGVRYKSMKKMYSDSVIDIVATIVKDNVKTVTEPMMDSIGYGFESET